eukprot:scaffold52619_cov49-Phaeocystis_antarctica.AAC.1
MRLDLTSSPTLSSPVATRWPSCRALRMEENGVDADFPWRFGTLGLRLRFGFGLVFGLGLGFGFGFGLGLGLGPGLGLGLFLHEPPKPLLPRSPPSRGALICAATAHR